MGEISYEQFGNNFVTQVVTPERVAATIARVAGSEVKAGPMQAGPGGAASVTATGRIGEITARVVFADTRLAFEATVPIALELGVRVAGVTHRYKGSLTVPLYLSVRAIEPVTIAIDIEPISPDNVQVRLSAEGVRARLLQRLGNVDDQVRRTVAKVVTERLDSPEAKEVRNLDILGYVDKAWNADPS